MKCGDVERVAQQPDIQRIDALAPAGLQCVGVRRFS